VDNANNETAFLIERTEGAAGTSAQIGTAGVSATAFSDTSVVNGVTYYYRVCANNINGNSAYSNEATIMPAPLVGCLAAGISHTIALKNDGTVWTWGRNNAGQLGLGSSTNDVLRPVNVVGMTPVAEVAAGNNHCLALTTDGRVWSWGGNGSGQLGDGTTTARRTPIQVPALGNTVQMIEGGESFSIALKNEGSVWTWGRNDYGQLGDGTSIMKKLPIQVFGFTAPVIEVAAGLVHSVALQSDGTVWTFGRNNYGQLGDGTNISKSTPVQVAGLANITHIAAGDYFSLAIRADGTVWSWGYNTSGQLGDGTTVNKLSPVQVLGLTQAVLISGGGVHALAVKSDGTIWAWGTNNYGQVGDGSITRRLSPVLTANTELMIGIAGGTSHNVGLKLDGSLWTWGLNTSGQLGDGSNANKLSPVKLPDLDLIP
jgi:alpha-tubulin suppressor-like RCC1 family protein